MMKQPSVVFLLLLFAVLLGPHVVSSLKDAGSRLNNPESVKEVRFERSLQDGTCMANSKGKGDYLYTCKLPFQYRDQWYDTCTTRDNDKAWCFHVGEGNKWGECANSVACGTNEPEKEEEEEKEDEPDPTPPPSPNPTEGYEEETFEPTDSPTRRPTEAPTGNWPKDPTEAPTNPPVETPEPTDPPATEAPTVTQTQAATDAPTNLVNTTDTSNSTNTTDTAGSSNSTNNSNTTGTGNNATETNNTTGTDNATETPSTFAPTLSPTNPTVEVSDYLPVQLTPFDLKLLIDNTKTVMDRRMLSRASRSDLISDLVHGHLMDTYSQNLKQPVAALQLLLLSQGEELIGDQTLVVTEQVLGSVFFAESTPTRLELDTVTQDALLSPAFLKLLEKSGDPLLQETREVAVQAEEYEESGSSDNDNKILGLSTTAFVAVLVTVICSLLSICILINAYLWYKRSKTHSTSVEMQESAKQDSETPRTLASHESRLFRDIEVNRKDDMVSDLESDVHSIYSYLPDDNNSVAAPSVAGSFVYEMPGLLDPPEQDSPDSSPETSMEQNNSTPGSRKSASEIEADLDQLFLDAQGKSRSSGERSLSSLENENMDTTTDLGNVHLARVLNLEEANTTTIGANANNFSHLWEEEDGSKRQMTLTQQLKAEDNRNWEEKYGIPKTS